MNYREQVERMVKEWSHRTGFSFDPPPVDPDFSIEECEKEIESLLAEKRREIISRAINFAHASMRPDAEVQTFLNHECDRLDWYNVIPEGCIGGQPCGATTDGAIRDHNRLSYFLQTGKDEFYPWQAKMRKLHGICQCPNVSECVRSSSR